MSICHVRGVSVACGGPPGRPQGCAGSWQAGAVASCTVSGGLVYAVESAARRRAPVSREAVGKTRFGLTFCASVLAAFLPPSGGKNAGLRPVLSPFRDVRTPATGRGKSCLMRNFDFSQPGNGFPVGGKRRFGVRKCPWAAERGAFFNKRSPNG